MQQFSFEKTHLGALLIHPFISDDERGLFIKDYSEIIFESKHITHPLKEIFYTYSHKGVIRAIHFQSTKEQAKLVRCIKGSVFDIIVDLRPESLTFGEWEAFELSSKTNQEILVPEHFGHGYLVLEDSIVSYKCAENFFPEYDDGIIWNDPELAIEWPLKKIEGLNNLIISDKDKNLQSFAAFKEKIYYLN